MTDAELAILSIVAEGPIYGHAIQTEIAERGLRAWTNIGVSSMYYVLEKLERQGLLESIGVPRTAGPARRQFRITMAGYGVLQTSVGDLLSTPREFGNGFDLGLANLHVLDAARIRAAFAAYQQELETRLHHMRSRRADLAEKQTPFNVIAMFDRHITLLEAERAWLIDFVAAWEAQAPPDEVEPPATQPDIPRMKQVMLPHDPDSPHRVPTRARKTRNRPVPVDSEAETAATLPVVKDTAFSAATPPTLRPAPDTAEDSGDSATRERPHGSETDTNEPSSG